MFAKVADGPAPRSGYSAMPTRTALRFCFDAVTTGTIAEGAALMIDRVAGQGRCAACREIVAMAETLRLLSALREPLRPDDRWRRIACRGIGGRVMCTVCGCGTTTNGSVATEPPEHTHTHDHAGHDHGRGAPSSRRPDRFRRRSCGSDRRGTDAGSARSASSAISYRKNDSYAGLNRKRLRESRTCCVNLVSSPGSGKTFLLVRAIMDLQARWPIAVIEGDQQTSRDGGTGYGLPAFPRSRSTPARAAISTRIWLVTRSTNCPRWRAACCSSRMSAIWFARRRSILASPPAWSCCR